MTKFFMILLQLTLAFATKYDYDLTSKCKTTESGICTEWDHNGNIEESTSCFPKNTFVMTFDGNDAVPVMMSNLEIDDVILGYNAKTKQPEKTNIRAWLHKNPVQEATYMIHHTEVSTITASPYHNMGTVQNDAIEYMFQSKLTSHNDLAYLTNGNTELTGDNILSTTREKKIGIYAPLTLLINYFVSDDGENFYLAHSFANIEKPEQYEYYVHKVFNVAEMIYPEVNRYDEEQYASSEYRNPIAFGLKEYILDIPETITGWFAKSNVQPTKFYVRGGNYTAFKSSNGGGEEDDENENEEEKILFFTTVIIPGLAILM